MRDNKAFASLTSGLLARKGQARPAMRPQGFTQGISQQDDLGWNDMGHDVPRVAGVRLPAGLAGPQMVSATVSIETPAPLPEVLRQQDEIVREFTPPVETKAVSLVPPAPEPETPEPEAAVTEAAVPEEALVPTQPVASAELVSDPVVAPAAESAPARAPSRKPRSARAAKLRTPVAAPREAGRKAAFTLRLATERHLLLRLACAVQNRSAQQIVTEALDRLLADLPDVARLAASLPGKD